MVVIAQKAKPNASQGMKIEALKKASVVIILRIKPEKRDIKTQTVRINKEKMNITFRSELMEFFPLLFDNFS